MENIMAYIQKLELFGFFSGYCLIYTILFSFKINTNSKAQTLLKKVIELLPCSYALVGTLYLGMVLKNLNLDFSIKNLYVQFQVPFLQIPALLSVLFWIPFFSKKTLLSLLHSLVFFFFLLKDIFMELRLPQGTEVIHNDTKVFTDSLLLNLIALIFVVLMYYSLSYFVKGRKRSS